MKWFKHMTASADDEKMAALVGQGGMEGLALYGAYWRVAEIVAKQMEGKTPSCAVTYPIWRWTQLLFVRKSHLCSILTRLKKEGLLVVEGDPKADSLITVVMPNLLKYRDEYSKKSGHAPDNIPSRTEAEGEGDTEAEAEKDKPLASTAIAVTADRGKLLGTLPLNDGSEWEIYEADLAVLKPLYPAVDVRQELRAMKGWLIGNPTHRKTRRGIQRFITSWLGKAQDRAKPGGNNHGKPSIDENIAAKQGVLDARRARRLADEQDRVGRDAETGLAGTESRGQQPAFGPVQ